MDNSLILPFTSTAIAAAAAATAIITNTATSTTHYHHQNNTTNVIKIISSFLLIIRLLCFQGLNKLPFHHEHCWYSCAYKANKRILYFLREQCIKTYSPSARYVIAANDIWKLLDIFGKNIISFEDTFSI
jgi:hypothetical protein